MSTSPLPIRTAVLGFGLAGKVFHCPFVRAVPGLQLSAIVVTNSERAAAAKAAYPDARILSTIDQILSDPAIDLVVVGTPNDTHVALAAAILRVGKHVVVDKPLATSSSEARFLIDLARKQGKILAPFHNRRFDNDFLTLSKLHREGTLGRITQVISHMDRFRPLVRPNTWKESGPTNGLLFDLGPHLVDQAVALFGTPSTVTATIRHDRDKTDIEDFISITFDYPNLLADATPRTLRYTCSATMLAADPSPRLRVHGTLGSYVKQGLDPQESALLHKGLLPPQLGSPEPWLPEPETSWGTLSVATKLTEPVELDRKPYPSVTGDYRLFYANVRDAINGTAPLIIPAEDAYRVISLLELAHKSNDQQRTLPVSFS
jgi:scyllo-inositol 2-dehydrogenase (NADP+)